MIHRQDAETVTQPHFVAVEYWSRAQVQQLVVVLLELLCLVHDQDQHK